MALIDTVKKCTTCFKCEPEIQFGVNSTSKSGFYSKCKCCRNKVSSKYRAENAAVLKVKANAYAKTEHCKARQKKVSAKHYLDNKEEHYLKNKKWRENNREKSREFTKKWASKNPHIGVRDAAKRRAAKLNATPKWFGEFDEFVIEIAYELAKEREATYGVKFHVDHIIPLQGIDVCGFHCGLNVQVITAYENLSKGNKYKKDIL